MGTSLASVKSLDSILFQVPMALPTQPFTLEGGLGMCSVYFGFHLLVVALCFGLFLCLASGCQSSEASQNDLAGHCVIYRGKTEGPEQGTSLSEVWAGQWSWARLGL